ncbi:rhamnan synthesis F family protein [Hoeflea sp.]|uniref:rhamnan synthesis F family protein n=1 Tax=Hoeflea sp. TaxID=1940281 RepID=UPI003B021E1D
MLGYFIRLLISTIFVQTHERFCQLSEFFKVRGARAGKNPEQLEELTPLKPGKILVFACYPLQSIDRTTISVLENFAKHGVQIVVVSNRQIAEESKAALRRISSAIIQRQSVGRDFGSYQRAMFYVQETLGFDSVSRLVFMNDSLYFFSNADTSPLVKYLLDDKLDYCAANENNEVHYHVGSYLFAVGEKVLRSDAFQRYWKNYLPYSTRRYTIATGEVGLTKTVTSSGFVPHVLYQLHELTPKVEAALAEKSIELHKLLSIPLKREIAPDDFVFSCKEIDMIKEEWQNKSQSHHLALLYVVFLNAPYIKKDLVYRGIFTITDILDLVKSRKLDDPETVMRIFRMRKTPATLDGQVERALYRFGMV